MNPSKQRIAKARVLVVGDAMLDRYWHGAVERISPEAPVPVVKVAREEERIGAAANVAYNVSTLGAQASFLGVVGDDEPGHRLESLLTGTGIRTHLKRDPGLRTTVKLRVIGRQQQLLRMDFENEPDHEVLALQNEAFASCCRSTTPCCSPTTARAAWPTSRHDRGRARGGKAVLIDPKGTTTPLRGASVITPNRPSCSRWSAAGTARTTAQQGAGLRERSS
jgi:bifunctional ADP-heptose synthase (sugar kinase/adenylyltransferase)